MLHPSLATGQAAELHRRAIREVPSILQEADGWDQGGDGESLERVGLVIQSHFEPWKGVCGGDVTTGRVGQQVCSQPWGCQSGLGGNRWR